MMKPATPLYKKVGRKYVPVAAHWYEDRDTDQMPVKSFRLTYAYETGARRYEFDVTPSTAPMAAAMLIARLAMEDAIRDHVRMSPSGTLTPYTKKQQAIIAKFRDDMGGLYPSQWTSNSAYEISEAAMKAVMGYAP